MTAHGSEPSSGDAPIEVLFERLALEMRTVTVTLRSALRDLEAAASLTDAKRRDLRGRWVERATVVLQDVRAHALQLNALHPEATDRPSTIDAMERALADVERLLRGEESATA